jgi:choloylglycine hydrolase
MQWQVAMDLTHRRYVLESTTRPNIIWVNFEDLDFSSTDSQAKLNLSDDLTVGEQNSGNVSRHFEC